jgi:AcrR family transcriptional regulator
MQEISLESGHPYATIYQYFDNKEAIFVAWLERFIDSSLFGLSRIILEKPDAEFNSYIEDSVHMALSETIKHQQTLHNLFDNMAMITSRLIELMEARALFWVKETFGFDFSATALSPMQQSLLTTIRAGNGYWLQLALNPQRKINLELESKNFAALVKALLVRE